MAGAVRLVEAGARFAMEFVVRPVPVVPVVALRSRAAEPPAPAEDPPWLCRS